MRFLIRTTPWHERRYAGALELADELRAQGGDVDLIEDPNDGTHASRTDRAIAGCDNWERALLAQGDDNVWHLEDDVVLTSRFCAKARSLSIQHPRRLIQAYSSRQADLAIGSRLEPGRSFVATLCVYMPGELAQQIAAYSPVYRATFDPAVRKHGPEPGYDTMTADFLHEHGLRYWIAVPSLVDHLDGGAGSLHSNPRGRGSLTFQP